MHLPGAGLLAAGLASLPGPRGALALSGPVAGRLERRGGGPERGAGSGRGAAEALVQTADGVAVAAPATAPVAWCAALSGNGGNWAVTLSFLSEALLLYLEEHPAATALDLRCGVGACSGAASLLVFRNLLANPSFGVPASGPASREQAHAVARALSFLALVTDLTDLEMASTLRHVVRTRLEDWGDRAWGKAVLAFDLPSLLVQFGHTLLLARHMDGQLAEHEVAAAIRGHCNSTEPECSLAQETLRAFASKAGMARLADLPQLQGRGATETEQEQLASVMKDIGAYAQGLMAQTLRRRGYGGAEPATAPALLRMGLGAELQTSGMVADPRSETELDRLLSESPDEGLISVTFAEARDPGESFLDSTFKGSHILALMARSTAEAILRSPSYRRKVLACRAGAATAACGRADRYVLAVVESLRPMLAVGGTEVGFMRPVVAPLSELGIAATFDPRANSSEAWALRPTSGPSARDAREILLGSWVERGLSVSLAEFYAEGSGRGEHVAYALFGKDRDAIMTKMSVEQLSRDVAEGEANWAEYASWAQHRPPGAFIDGSANWDCGKFLPAHVTRDSWQQRLHGAARARAGRGASGQQILDPMGACEGA